MLDRRRTRAWDAPAEAQVEGLHPGSIGSAGYVSGEKRRDVVRELHDAVEEVTGRRPSRRRVTFFLKED